MSEDVKKLVLETWKKNLMVIGGISIILLLFPQRLPLIAGLCLGSVVAMLNFFVLAWNTESIMDKEGSFAFSFGFFYILRIFLSGLCIYLGIRLQVFHLVTVVIGLFSIRISMTVKTFFEIVFGALKKSD